MPRPELRLIAAAGIATSVAAFASLAGSDTTYAAFSDFDSRSVSAGAGVWAPDPPAACGDISKYGTPPERADAVIWGDAGDNVIRAGSHPQIIMGMGGNDTLFGGNGGDCLVGGDGADKLYGTNAKDILIGGPGDDLLDGGNGPDYLDGGDGDDSLDGGNGPDTCLGGGGDDTIVNCEPGSPAPPRPALSKTTEHDPASTPAEDPANATGSSQEQEPQLEDNSDQIPAASPGDGADNPAPRPRPRLQRDDDDLTSRTIRHRPDDHGNYPTTRATTPARYRIRHHPVNSQQGRPRHALT